MQPSTAILTVGAPVRGTTGVPEVGDSVTFLAAIQRMQYHPLMFHATDRRRRASTGGAPAPRRPAAHTTLCGGLGLDALP